MAGVLCRCASAQLAQLVEAWRSARSTRAEPSAGPRISELGAGPACASPGSPTAGPVKRVRARRPAAILPRPPRGPCAWSLSMSDRVCQRSRSLGSPAAVGHRTQAHRPSLPEWLHCRVREGRLTQAKRPARPRRARSQADESERAWVGPHWHVVGAQHEADPPAHRLQQQDGITAQKSHGLSPPEYLTGRLPADWHRQQPSLDSKWRFWSSASSPA